MKIIGVEFRSLPPKLFMDCAQNTTDKNYAHLLRRGIITKLSNQRSGNLFGGDDADGSSPRLERTLSCKCGGMCWPYRRRDGEHYCQRCAGACRCPEGAETLEMNCSCDRGPAPRWPELSGEEKRNMLDKMAGRTMMDSPDWSRVK